MKSLPLLLAACVALAGPSAPVVAQEAAPDAPEVQLVDAREFPMSDARLTAANASRNKVAIVVWGGNRAIQQEAYFAARDLVGVGIPVAFMVGPDHNSLDGDAVVQIYAASSPRYDGYGGSNNAADFRPSLREAGREAYQEAFPDEWRELQARRGQ